MTTVTTDSAKFINSPLKQGVKFDGKEDIYINSKYLPQTTY